MQKFLHADWLRACQLIPISAKTILVTRALDLMAARDPRIWETLQEFSQNLAIWTSRRMLSEQTGN